MPVFLCFGHSCLGASVIHSQEAAGLPCKQGRWCHKVLGGGATCVILLCCVPVQVISVVACADGTHAASIGADGYLRLWDLLSGKCLSNQAAHSSGVPQYLYLVHDGSRAYSGAGDRSVVAWDMKTGTPTVCLPAKEGSRTKFIHVSADGSSAVVLLFDSSMAVYDTATGKLRCHLMQKGERDARRVHSGGVNAVYLTADGSRAVSVSKDCTARIWDVVTGGCELVLQVGLRCFLMTSHPKHSCVSGSRGYTLSKRYVKMLSSLCDLNVVLLFANTCRVMKTAFMQQS